MFGVLVVQDKEGNLGYLSAFSGKLAGSIDHPKFVPPVFDMLIENSFFLKEQEIIHTINLQIRKIESGDNYKNLKQDLERSNTLSIQEISDFKKQLKINKAARKNIREEQKSSLSEDAYSDFEADLIKQSLYDKHLLNVLVN
ncbi:MAG: pseudouridine synthase, partial [Mucilaginibacter sp.]|nr:pseudouridine synthase [Mucilaginibacter sp.]